MVKCFVQFSYFTTDDGYRWLIAIFLMFVYIQWSRLCYSFARRVHSSNLKFDCHNIYWHLCCLLFTSCGYYHVLGKCKWFLTVLCVVWYSIKFSSVLPGRCLFSLRKNRLCDHIPWSLVYFVGLVGYVQYSDLSNDVMRCCLPGNIFQVLQIAALLRKIHSSRDSFANESSVISLLCPHGRPFKYFSLR